MFCEVCFVELLSSRCPLGSVSFGAPSPRRTTLDWDGDFPVLEAGNNKVVLWSSGYDVSLTR